MKPVSPVSRQYCEHSYKIRLFIYIVDETCDIVDGYVAPRDGFGKIDEAFLPCFKGAHTSKVVKLAVDVLDHPAHTFADIYISAICAIYIYIYIAHLR